MAEMPKEELKALIAENPLYGNVICRCETVTEGEIVNAIRRPLGAKSLDGVKRRTRAGMGRCQSGFCAPKVMEILERSKNLLWKSQRQGRVSTLLIGKIKRRICIRKDRKVMQEYELIIVGGGRQDCSAISAKRNGIENAFNFRRDYELGGI